MHLTKSKIDKLTFEGKEIPSGGYSQDIRWDDEIPGFGIRVYPPKDSGRSRKSFVISYRVHGRKRIKVIGAYGILTLQQARDKARILLAKTIENEDPFEDRTVTSTTMKEFGDIYITRYAQERKKTWKTDKNRIDRHILPRIGNHRLKAITRPDIVKLHAEIGEKAKYEANRVLALLSVMFNLAIKWGYLEEGTINPCDNVDKFKEKSRDRYVKPEEMPRLAKAINEEPNIYIRAVLWLYLFTGMRKNELLRAEWDWIDWDRKEIRIPDTKQGKVHYVPLNQPALVLLNNLPREQDNPYIFPSPVTDSHLVNISKNWRRIRDKANLRDVHLHDLRRTVGSYLAEAGVPLKIIGGILGHSELSTTEIYARLSESAGREALEEHGERLKELMEGKIDE